MTHPIPALRDYGRYLESLERPLDIEALVAEGSARRSGSTTPQVRDDDPARDLDAPRTREAELVPLDDRVATTDLEPARADRTGRRRWLVAAAAVLAAALIATTLALAGTGDDEIRTEPADPAPAPTTAPPPPTTTNQAPPQTTPEDASTEGLLLPEGAPSTPPVGELVASAAPGFIVSGSDAHFGAHHLYADGRLIRWDDGAGGYVEQRLTPEGVERVRSVFLVSGLFDLAAPPSGVSPCTDMFQVCVRGDDGQLRSTTPGPVVAPLVSYLESLDASLPETEWEDEEIRPYVASRIVACAQTYLDVPEQVVPVAHDPSVLLPLLPEGAASLLSSRVAIVDPSRPPDASCYDVTLEEARALEDELLGPAVGGSHQYWGIVIQDDRFDVIQPDATEGIAVYISFDALLPDGVPTMPPPGG